jgi:[acyl-carrier-protein] S-malonyltransferase
MSLASETGARRVVRLAVSVPAHCDLMESAASALAQRLAQANFKSPQIPVVQNVDVKTHEEASEIRRALALRLHRPVRWTETIEAMRTQGVGVILEMGPGRVLTGLNKRIDRRLKGLSVQDPAGLEKALQYCEEGV